MPRHLRLPFTTASPPCPGTSSYHPLQFCRLVGFPPPPPHARMQAGRGDPRKHWADLRAALPSGGPSPRTNCQQQQKQLAALFTTSSKCCLNHFRISSSDDNAERPPSCCRISEVFPPSLSLLQCDHARNCQSSQVFVPDYSTQPLRISNSNQPSVACHTVDA